MEGVGLRVGVGVGVGVEVGGAMFSYHLYTPTCTDL